MTFEEWVEEYNRTQGDVLWGTGVHIGRSAWDTATAAATCAERARCLNKIVCYVTSMGVEPYGPTGMALEAVMHAIQPALKEGDNA